MRHKPSRNMLKARKLRKQGKTLEEVGEEMGITKQGAKYLLQCGDKWLSPPLSTRQNFIDWRNKNYGEK